MEKKVVKTSVSLPPDVYEWARQKAEKERRSLSSLIAIALDEYRNKDEEGDRTP